MSEPMLPNRITRDVINERTKICGADAAKGRDSQIKFMMTLLEGSYHSVLDPVKHKDHQGNVTRDDAEDLAKLYYESQSGANVFDSKANNQRKLISTARTALKGGQCTKGDILQTVNDLMNIRNKLRKDPGQAPHLLDATNVLMKALRLQMKPERSTPLEPEEMRALCYRTVKAPKALKQFWEDMAKTFRKLRMGTLNSSTLQDTVPVVDTMEQMAKDRLKQLELNTETETEAEEAAT